MVHRISGPPGEICGPLGSVGPFQPPTGRVQRTLRQLRQTGNAIWVTAITVRAGTVGYWRGAGPDPDLSHPREDCHVDVSARHAVDRRRQYRLRGDRGVHVVAPAQGLGLVPVRGFPGLRPAAGGPELHLALISALPV